MSVELLRNQVNLLNWFHSLDFGNGVVTKGLISAEILKAQADIYFPSSLEDKSVVDVGCWDGFNTFEAIRRGAKRVVAADHFVWHHGSRAAFDLAS
jgi:tRNA (mo5U34)-methyltransferase